MNDAYLHNRRYEYIDGELTPDERQAFEGHLRTCAACKAEMQSLNTLHDKLSQLPDSIQPKHDLWKNIELKLQTHPQPLISGLEKRRNGKHTESHEFPATRPVMWYARAAAVVLIFIAAGMIWYLSRNSLPQEKITQRDSQSPVQQNNIPKNIEPLAVDHQTDDNKKKELQSPAHQAKSIKQQMMAGKTVQDSLLKRIEEQVKLSPAPLALAKFGKIVGSVSDENGQLLQGVTIRIAELKREVMSDADGEFQLLGVPAGTYTLQARGGAEHEKDVTAVKIIPGFTALLNFELNMGTVTVKDLVMSDDGKIANTSARALSRSLKLYKPFVPPDINNSAQIQRPSVGTGIIIGKVTSDSTQALPGITILVVGTQRGGFTDADGKYSVFNIPAGEYTVKASGVGYSVKEIVGVKIAAGKTTSLNFSLRADTVQLREVVVTADAQLVNSLTTSATQTTAPKNAGSSVNVKSVGDVLKLQAGVVTKGNNLYLRSGRAGEVQYLVNGVPAYSLHRSSTAVQPNAEQYDNISENDFHDVVKDPLSTFSIDVDNASYSNMRRFINAGQLPPKDAVRIEEMVNYFSYDYPQPGNDDPFSITTELASCPWNSSDKLLLIGLQGKNIASEHLPPSNLVFLIDVSGSMNEPNKLPLVKSAFKLLVGQLREQDRVSIVVYAGNAGLVLPSTPGSNKERILSAIDRLEAGGSTAGGEGLQLAYNVAKENFMNEGNNRIILATDGDFNVGVSSDEGLVKLIEERRDQGIYLSVLGFGMGNYKDAKMEKLADKGNGNYAYIDNIQEAKKVFVSQMAGTLFTIAKDVKIQIEFNPANVKSYRLIGYENRMLAKEDFNDDRKDAGELGAGHTVTALYEIVPSREENARNGVDPLKYQSDHSERDMQNGRYTDEILTVKLRYKSPKENSSKLIVGVLRDHGTGIDAMSDNFRFAASVAEFGMLLRDSKFKGSSAFDQVMTLARNAKGSDLEGYRSEFIRLVESAKLLSK